MQIIKISDSGKNVPKKILSELKKINSLENGDVFDYGKINLGEIYIGGEEEDEKNWKILKKSQEGFYKNNKIFFLGDSIDICYPIIKSFNNIEENPCVIVFDAHTNYKKNGPESWLRKLLQEDYTNVILISARNFDLDEQDFLKKNNIVWIKMDVLDEDLAGVCDIVMERARNSTGFYININMNSLDFCSAPGVENFEIGGLNFRNFIYFIKRLSFLRNFRGASIVGINLKKDLNNVTLKSAARILAEMIK